MRYVVTALAVAVAACYQEPAPVAMPTAVKVAVVEHAPNAAGTHYSAQINPATQLDLSFKVGGYVESVARERGVDNKPRLLQEGDRVRAGMQLAAIRRTDYAQKLAEARAAHAQAKAGVEQALIDFERTKRLAEHSAVAGAELDSARTRRDGAVATLSGARARLDQAGTALSDTVLRSPLDGVVLKRSVEVGALAAPGTVAFTVADVGSVKAAFGVPDIVLPRVRLGANLIITSEAYPGESFEGRISLIAPSADPRSRVFEIEVTIPNTDGRLRPGSVAALALDSSTADLATASSPLIPLSAIVRSPTQPSQFAVFVVEKASGKTIAKAKNVTLGEYLGRVIPVKQGLTSGELVVVQGAGLLSDGEAVEVIQ